MKKTKMKKTNLWVVLGVVVVAAAAFLLLRQADEVIVESASSGKSLAEGEVQSEGVETGLESEAAEGQTSTNRPLVSSEPENEPESRPGARDMMERMRASMEKRNEEKAAKLIAKLAQDLNLSPEQVAELEAHFEKMVEQAGGMLRGDVDRDDPMAGMKALAALEGKGLDELMEELLTPEQQEKWGENEEKRVQRLADSGALKKLAGLGSVIEMREEQRDAVYEHFYQKQLEAAKNSSEGGAMATALSGITTGFGVEMDFSELADMDYSALAQESSGEDGKLDVQALMRKQREQQINNKVEELDEILDESQLNDYREHLESQGPFLDGIISGHDSIEVQSIVIPGVQ